MLSYLQYISLIDVTLRKFSCSAHCAALKVETIQHEGRRIHWHLKHSSSLEAHIKGSPTWCPFANCTARLDYWSARKARIKWPPKRPHVQFYALWSHEEDVIWRCCEEPWVKWYSSNASLHLLKATRSVSLYRMWLWSLHFLRH